MSLVDVQIIEILDGPKQVITDDFCGWIVKVKTGCWGYISERTFTATTKSKIEQYKVGYTWSE